MPTIFARLLSAVRPRATEQPAMTPLSKHDNLAALARLRDEIQHENKCHIGAWERKTR